MVPGIPGRFTFIPEATLDKDQVKTEAGDVARLPGIHGCRDESGADGDGEDDEDPGF